MLQTQIRGIFWSRGEAVNIYARLPFALTNIVFLILINVKNLIDLLFSIRVMTDDLH